MLGPDLHIDSGRLAIRVLGCTSREVGQTYAMAMARTGDFEHAVKLQQETIVAYERMGVPQMKPFLERNLAAYRQNKPSREPWARDDPIFQPRSPAASRH